MSDTPDNSNVPPLESQPFPSAGDFEGSGSEFSDYSAFPVDSSQPPAPDSTTPSTQTQYRFWVVSEYGVLMCKSSSGLSLPVADVKRLTEALISGNGLTEIAESGFTVFQKFDEPLELGVFIPPSTEVSMKDLFDLLKFYARASSIRLAPRPP
jgi:hypothetical protein